MAVRDVVQAAAGQGGEEATYVEDVFSTYLYTGNGSTQTIENGIALGDGNYGPSVEFDGISDYLSRSSDMTGNADGKTFTFSCWVYALPTSEQKMLYSTDVTDNGFKIYIQSNNTLGIEAWNSSGTMVLQSVTSTQIPLYTWTSIIVSLDAANTSNRSVYINDVLASSTWYTYSNLVIDFTRTTHKIGFELAARYIKGRLSHVFLDYTYRDLSVEANRRLFITADGQPATGLASLSPILYMPLDGSTASVGTNSGTGGDFTVNGSPTVLTQGGPYIEAGYGQGGMVWLKSRGSATFPDHRVYDTERGATNSLATNQTWDNTPLSTGLTAFNSNGFTHGEQSRGNQSGITYASWTFRKAPKFFDVVTWTGNNVSGRQIPHNLGSVPGCIIVKNILEVSNWEVWHRGVVGVTETAKARLNSTAGFSENNNYFSDNNTSSDIVLGGLALNELNKQYIAYVFAHNAGGFGDDGEQNVISCGSYTGNGSTDGPEIDLGWEPQFLMFKRATGGTANWMMVDNMRGLNVTGRSELMPNLANAEYNNTTSTIVEPTSTGFKLTANTTQTNTASSDYIYIAIRRPMKTPESGTEVFNVTKRTSGNPNHKAGFVVDMFIRKYNAENDIGSRLTGTTVLRTESTAAELSNYDYHLDQMTGIQEDQSANSAIQAYMFKRAPGFMDVVAYTTEIGSFTRPHNLGVAPEIMILKNRGGFGWYFMSSAAGTDKTFFMQTSIAPYISRSYWPTDPDASNLYLGGQGGAYPYIAYLFASLAGISKCGSYIGTGADLNVDCGFSSGARFVLIKRYDGTPGSSVGDWYVWDSARGIVAGNDPYILLNSIAAEVTNTDYIDPLASGFTVTSSAPAALNASGGSYIFLAIA